MGGFAWVTLATNDSYSLGALVLAHSLRRVGTQHDLAVLITPGVTESMREKLISVFTLVREVNVLDSKDETNLAVLQRPELGITFTKLHCWRLTEYEKCVFIDADALVVRNCDELFEREELSAAPDVGWPDCFNSGVFVYRPSQQTFASLTAFAASQGSFDGADQGLLNMYFSDWAHKDISKHLPFIYNMCSTATYSYAPAFKQYGENVRIVHFIGVTKPWLQYFDTLTGIVQPPPGCNHLQPLLQIWWNIFCDNVHPQLTDVMGGLAGALAKLTLGESRSDEQKAIEDHMRKQNWEQGNIDFMGRDSFDNIMKKINETLATAPTQAPPSVKETRQSEKGSSKSSEVEAAIEESEVALPVLAIEKQTESSSGQEASKETCQRILCSETESCSRNDTPQETTSPNLTTNETECEQTSLLTEAADVPIENIVLTRQSELSPEIEKLESSLDEKDKDVPTSLMAELDISQAIKQCVEPEAAQQTLGDTITASVDTPQIISPILAVSSETKPLDEPSLTEGAVQIVSEATTECPVPIQVAESVLQAEPKETVSEDSRPTVEAVASSIVLPVTESAASLVESSQTAGTHTATNLQQLNGNDPSLQTPEPSTPLMENTALAMPKPSVTSLVETPKLEIQEEIQSEEKPNLEVESQIKADDLRTSLVGGGSQSSNISTDNVEAPSSQKTKLTVKLSQTVADEGLCSTDKQSDEISCAASECTPECKTEQESPERPNRSKDLKIPGTPIVIGPTPPTSPPLDIESVQAMQTEIQKDIQPEHTVVETKTVLPTEEQLESQSDQKNIVQMVKKSSTESDSPSSPESEGSSKKVVKKVVKKVAKKTKASEESEGSGSADKSKKTTKTVKKVAKTSATSSDGKAASDSTPSSPSADAPIPPKRKAKTSSKVTEKKPAES